MTIRDNENFVLSNVTHAKISLN